MKRPSMQWYAGDWLKDPALGQCSPATRGIWMDMLCLMHENDESGELRGSVESLARICRCTPKEMRTAIEELRVTNAADVTLGHKNGDEISVICRRMSRKYKERVNARNRKRKERGGEPCHGEVTPIVEEKSRSLSSSSSSTSVDPPFSPPTFEAAWSRYPKRAGGNPKSSALRAWQARIAAGADPAVMLAGVERYAAFCEATGRVGTEFVKQAATFFGPDQHYTEDWTPPRSNGNGRYETAHDRIARLNPARPLADADGRTTPGGAGAVVDQDGRRVRG